MDKPKYSEMAHTFKLIKSEYIRRTSRMLIVDVSVLLILCLFFWSSWSESWPVWVELLILGPIVVDLSMNLFAYLNSETYVADLSFIIYDRFFGVQRRGKITRSLLSDIKIHTVEKKDGKVVSFRMSMGSSQKFKMHGIEDLDKLYTLLTTNKME
ncbi:MAG: hypothetical protein GXP09_09275 [Gammaproteobacteria bacterium]|nr:hypothetical protein [Gammaproteobacteria bacterium]